jgi:D-glycero-D-manno-heptose 1,7-bisphosphate phosphatase
LVSGAKILNDLHKAAFIDRDGVINRERGFVHRIEDFEFIPGAIDALRALKEGGYLLVVVTNQSGIARGLYAEDDYLRLTDHMSQMLAASGVSLAAALYCPHLPQARVQRYRVDCDCRKPRPGMLRRAAVELGIDVSESILIGDRISDVEAGRAAGVRRCYLVRSGLPLTAHDAAQADAVYEDIAACVRSMST